ncbi:MAG: BatA domain-containing protein [Phycisphaerae bacterium]|nr:BatA domain-containing protein [Phycisphaerae bacterium]
MNFLYGAMLWGGLAVAAPIVIHLLMRPRPRREPLPTIRFLRNLQRKHFAKLKWKHVLLLALRCAAVLLIVLLLARAFLPGSFETPSTAPTALVVVLDTSASMGYRHQGRTVLQRGQLLATERIESLSRDSAVAVLTTSSRATTESFLPDAKLAAQQVGDALLGQDDAPLGASLAAAKALLASRNEPYREILVVTDLTKPAWRNCAPLSIDPEIRVTVLDVGVQRGANAALRPPRVDCDTVPPGSDVTVRSTLWSEHLTGAMRLELFAGDQAVEQRSVDLTPLQALPISFTARAEQTGVLTGTLKLQTDDPLPIDNARYFTVDVSAEMEALLVGASSGTNPTVFLMGNAVAPPMPGRADAPRRRTLRPEQLTDKATRKAAVVILADAPALTPVQWKQLEDACREGLGLWIVPGEAVQASSYNSPEAQRLLPTKLGKIQTLPKRLGVSPPDTNLPMFQPFAPGPEANPPLSDVQVQRRFTVDSVAADASVALTYTDGQPAILTRDVGAGRVVLWTFSPVRDWSNLARLGGQFVVLAQRTARLLTDMGNDSRRFAPDQMIELPTPRGFHLPDATLQRQPDAHPTPVTFTLTQGTPRSIRLAPQPVGNYILTLREGKRTRPMGFSVNTPPGESDLSRLTPGELETLFPNGVSLGAATEAPIPVFASVRREMDLTCPIFLILLAILPAEAFLANRFHRSVDSGD